MGKKAAKTPEQIGREAAEVARKTVLRQAKSVGLTTRKTLKRIAEGLDAKKTAVSYDKDRGRWAYSDPMIDFPTRAEYVKLAMTFHDMKPSEKLDVNVNLNLPERLREARERAAKRGTD